MPTSRRRRLLTFLNVRQLVYSPTFQFGGFREVSVSGFFFFGRRGLVGSGRGAVRRKGVQGVLWPTLAEPTLAKTKFGRTNFGQVWLEPSLAEPSLAKPTIFGQIE